MLKTLALILGLLLFLIFLLPFVVYLCVKAGVYGYFRGIEAFESYRTKLVEDLDNGEQERSEES